MNGFSQLNINSVFLDTFRLKATIPPNYDLKINEILASNYSGITDEYGEYDDWIELYNYGEDSIELNGLYISDKKNNPMKWQFQADCTLAPDSYIIIWADEQTYQGMLHTNFKLSSDGESLYLYSPGAVTMLDSCQYGEQHTDISYGRLSNNFFTWNYFISPTPGELNEEEGLFGITGMPEIDMQGGFYNSSFTVSVVNTSPGTDIYYTLDGSIPTVSSTKYTVPVLINQTSVLRLIAYKPGNLQSKIVSHSYLFNKDNTLDVISIVADSDHLYGSNGLISNKHNDIEQPVHIEFFGKDKQLKFSQDVGAKVHAAASNAQTAFRFYARSLYGQNDIHYKIFEYKKNDSYKRLILRNAGNDGIPLVNSRTHFRDAFEHLLYMKIHPEGDAISAYKPVSVYINGEFWGVYNLRERIDRYYIKNNFNYEGDMDLLEWAFGFPGNKNPMEGSWELMDSIKSFAENNNLNIQSNYNFISNYVDIEHFTDYWIFEVFIGNFDWLCNNIKIFRPNIPGGKFRWILWDLDHGFGLPYSDYGLPTWNTLAWATSTEYGRPGEGRTTVLIRNLLENGNYKNYFINRFADLLNVYFKPDFVSTIIDSVHLLLYSEMDLEFSRWGSSYTNWNNAVQNLHNYAQQRPNCIREHIKEKFELKTTYSIRLDVSPENSGRIQINTLKGNEFTYPWEGVYFSDVPVTIKAIPAPGYEFLGWEGVSSEINEITFIPDDDIELTALFAPKEVDVKRIIINEINYHSHNKNNSEDWVEIVNSTGTSVNLSGWKLNNKKGDSYQFPSNTILDDEEIIVVCCNMNAFRNYYPNVYNIIGNMPYDLSNNGDTIYLYNKEDEIIDVVAFDDKQPWPVLPDGEGFTLELKHPFLENEFYQNWRSSIKLYGTPGKQNSVLKSSAHGIFINEIQARNLSTVHDEFHEYDDWIELYNSRNYSIDIGGLFITDNLNNPLKYQIPADDTEVTTIGPKEYLIIWADDNIHQGAHHLSFKLEAKGESVGLMQNNGYELYWIDTVTYGPQAINQSYGRYIDGANAWYDMAPTPGSSNRLKVTALSEVVNNEGIMIFPNPSYGNFYIMSDDLGLFNIEVFNSMGQLVYNKSDLELNDPVLINIPGQKGIYIIRIYQNDINTLITRKIIIM